MQVAIAAGEGTAPDLHLGAKWADAGQPTRFTSNCNENRYKHGANLATRPQPAVDHPRGGSVALHCRGIDSEIIYMSAPGAMAPQSTEIPFVRVDTRKFLWLEDPFAT